MSPLRDFGNWLVGTILRPLSSSFRGLSTLLSRAGPSHSQLLSAINDTGVLILTTDLSGKIVNLNGAGATGLGWGLAAIRNRFVWEFLDDPSEISWMRDTFRGFNTGVRPTGFVCHWKTESGEVRVLTWSLQTTPAHVVLIGRDVSEISWTQSSLAGANVSGRQLLEQIPAVVWTVDANLIITTSFGGALSKIGYKTDQLVGVSLQEYLNTHNPEDPGIIRHRRALAGETVVHEGEVMGRILESTLIPLRDELGGIRGAMGLAIDVTERRKLARACQHQSEELRIMLDSCQSYVWYKDRNNVILRANASAARSVDLTVEQIVGCSAYDLYPKDAAKYHRDDLEVINSGKAKLGIVERYLLPSGVRTWVRTDKIPNRSPDGDVIGVIVFATDITAQKTAEENLLALAESERQLRLEAERLSSLKDEFLITLSHEIRSPLTPIIGWTDVLLAKTETNNETRNILEIISRNAKVQLQLVEDLLDTSKVMAGKLLLKTGVVKLSELIQDALEGAQPASHAKQIEVKVDIVEPGIVVVGDSLRLQQVIWNLLSNAIKFTPSGGAVRIQLRQTPTETLLQVSDSGIGLKPELLQVIFERFRQADSTTTRKYGGLGLGLSLVRQLVEAHGGTVTAESAGLGCGSTFTVRLPTRMSGRQRETREPVRELEASPVAQA